MMRFFLFFLGALSFLSLSEPLLAVQTYLDQEALVISDNRLVIRDHAVGVNTDNLVASFNVDGDIMARGTFSFGAVPTMSSFYIDGAGFYDSSAAHVYLNGTAVATANAIPTHRGLFLVIVNALDHTLVSSTQYDTHNNNANAALLATAMEAMTNDQIGLLMSYDAYEMVDNSTATDWFATLRDTGLHQLYNSQGSQNTLDTGSYRHAYAAVFQKGANSASAKAVEVIQLQGASLPRAKLGGFLMGGTFYAGNAQAGAVYPSNGEGLGVMYSSDTSGAGNLGFGIRAGSTYPVRVYEKAILGDVLYFEGFANDGVHFERTESDMIFHVNDNDDDQIIFGDDNFTTKKFRFNFDGHAFATSWNGGGADYAEWFAAEEKVVSGDVVGINPQTGLVRKLRAGDTFLGVHSTAPGFVGNAQIDEVLATEQATTHALIGLSGQLAFDPNQVKFQGRSVYTMTDDFMGYLLANGKVLIR